MSSIYQPRRPRASPLWQTIHHTTNRNFEIFKAPDFIPAPPKQSARDMRPLWRDLILKVWGGDPLKCPCCPKNLGKAVWEDTVATNEILSEHARFRRSSAFCGVSFL